MRYWRFAVFRLRNPHVVTEGMVFFGKRVEVSARRGYGRLVIGQLGPLRRRQPDPCHEGSLRIGDKCVFGRDATVNCYLDIELGAATIVADWVYICDFDHASGDLDAPIKDQGIVKSPVRIGGGSWLGTKVSVLRGAEIGAGRSSRPMRWPVARRPSVRARRGPGQGGPAAEPQSRDGWA